MLTVQPRSQIIGKVVEPDGENNCCIPPTLERWVYIVSTHGPLDGPLYTWAQYTPTPRRSLNYRRTVFKTGQQES